ncbi:MAG: hypothetical protein QOD53_1392 [Thermoleophilaceae bacterium]|jgi:hypothetical protein|nr:hypothetical protein [Thermoleophilaceae bacterium]
MSSPADADLLLGRSRRPLVLGIGGGGDVVGALATAEHARLDHGASPIVGGVSWERRPIDPAPGPRTVAEIEGGRPLAPSVLGAGAGTCVRDSGVRFAESRMAELLGQETVLVDPTSGPARVAADLARAADALGADLMVFIDVGGDVLAHGDEPGLASPLCDAVMLAAAGRLQAEGRPVLGGVFGPGCDGELTLAELDARFAEIGAAGGLAGARGIGPAVAELLEGAVAAIPTEASAQAVRAFHGARGPTAIRSGRRTLQLSPVAAMTVYFDVATAIGSAARLAAAVDGAASLDEANEVLHGLGLRTELDYEAAAAAQKRQQ